MRIDSAICALAICTSLSMGADREACAGERQPIESLLKAVKSVGREGAGHAAASAAWEKLAKAQPAELTTLLAGLDDAQPLAANWIRAAIDAVAERTIADGGQLPLADLEEFLKDTRHDPRARRLAFELVTRGDATAADRLLPRMLDDPSLELRRDSVARVLEEASQLVAAEKTDEAAKIYRRALTAARDLDQVQAAAEKLRKLGETVDLAAHFGFVRSWKLIGPFDNAGKKGFDVAYPPESAIDLTATHPGKEGMVKWIDHTTSDEFGAVDLDKALGKNLGVCGYAYAQFKSDRARPVELRIGTDDAYKVWLNGELLASAHTYHTGFTVDQYVARGQLKAGRNLILIKICQNEQIEDWAQFWRFQLRVCDATGTAIAESE